MSKRAESTLIAAFVSGSVLALLAGAGLYFADAPKVLLLSGAGVAFGLGVVVELITVKATWASAVAGVVTLMLALWLVALWPNWSRFFSGANRYDPQLSELERPAPGDGSGRGTTGTPPDDSRRRRPRPPPTSPADRAAISPDGEVDPEAKAGSESARPTVGGADGEGGDASLSTETRGDVGIPRSLTVRNRLGSDVEVALEGPGVEGGAVRLSPGEECELRLGDAPPALATVVWRHGEVEERVPWTVATAAGTIMTIGD